MKYKVEIMSPSFCGDELKYLENAFWTNEISTKGENINRMSKMLVEYTGRKYCTLLSNGTAGLHLALKALDVSDNDIVFCPTLTYCGTVYPIIYERAVPVFIDCKKDGTMDEECLKIALSKYKDNLPKAVMAVDTYGSSADYSKILSVLKDYNIPLISDSAESLGGEYEGKKSGSFGDISVISFSYSKIVTTSMGGAVLSDNKEYMDKMAYLANQSKASSKCYIHKEVGYNYLMSNLLAGIGISQMERIDQFLEKKRAIFNTYKKAFKNIEGISFISDKEGSNHWQCGVILNNDNAHEIVDKLISNGIETRCGFNPMHRQEAFSGFDYITKDDISTDLFYKTILLPSGTGMTIEQQEYVINVFNDIIKGRV